MQADPTMQSVSVTMSTSSGGTSTKFLGLSQGGQGHSVCKTQLPARTGSISGKAITVDDTTLLQLDSSKVSVVCNRQMQKDLAGNKFAEAQTLYFNTQAGIYQVPMGAIGSLSPLSIDQVKADIQASLQKNPVQSSPSIIVGQVIAVATADCPDGSIAANGVSYPTNMLPALFTAIGYSHGGSGKQFNVPDYRGRFLRGVDGNAGNDPDKDSRVAMNTGGNAGNFVGSVQADMFASHTHSYRGGHDTPWDGSVGNMYGLSTYMGTYENGFIGAKGGSETRPKNAYVNFCIGTGQ